MKDISWTSVWDLGVNNVNGEIFLGIISVDTWCNKVDSDILLGFEIIVAYTLIFILLILSDYGSNFCRVIIFNLPFGDGWNKPLV